MISGPAGRAVRHVAVQLAVHLAAAPGQVVGAARLLAPVDQHVVRRVASGVGPDVIRELQCIIESSLICTINLH